MFSLFWSFFEKVDLSAFSGGGYGRVNLSVRLSLDALGGEFLEAIYVSCGGFGDEATFVGEMYVGLGFDLRVVEGGVVIESRDPVACVATVWIDRSGYRLVETLFSEEVTEASGWIVAHGIGAGDEEKL